LGEDAFADAWSAGEATELDDAVAFALRGWGPRQRPQAGWDSLTPTELKVVALVAEGLTNPQIGERLFVSKRTVSAHLRNVFGKLGVSTRAELAAVVTRRGV
jgi:DNA-binding CsgD family transcriptional regulator